MSRVNNVNSDRKLDINVCAVCNKKCVYAETRLAEMPSIKQEGDTEDSQMECRTYQAIGIRYIHFDKSVCDKPLYELVEM